MELKAPIKGLEKKEVEAKSDLETFNYGRQRPNFLVVMRPWL